MKVISKDPKDFLKLLKKTLKNQHISFSNGATFAADNHEHLDGYFNVLLAKLNSNNESIGIVLVDFHIKDKTRTVRLYFISSDLFTGPSSPAEAKEIYLEGKNSDMDHSNIIFEI